MIKSRRLKWADPSARMEKGRSAFKMLTGKPARKRPLERPRRVCVSKKKEHCLIWNVYTAFPQI